MKKRSINTIFGKICFFIGWHGVKASFTTKELREFSDFKTSNVLGDFNTMHQYIGKLRKTGFLERTKRGTYKIMYKIPPELTVTDLECGVGYITRATYSDTGKYHTVDRKINPFDIKAYQRREDEKDNEILSVYTVDMETGNIAYKLLKNESIEEVTKKFNIFETIEEAEAFAEGILKDITFDIEEEDLELNTIQNDIAKDVLSTMFDRDNEISGFNDESNTEEKSRQFINIHIPIGTKLYIISTDVPGEDFPATFSIEYVENIKIKINAKEVKYNFITNRCNTFNLNSLGKSVFLDKELFLNKISSML